MKKLFLPLILTFLFFTTYCTKKTPDKQIIEERKEMSAINDATIKKTTDMLLDKYGDDSKTRIEKGVAQTASFWTDADGPKDKFTEFCMKNFIAGDDELNLVFDKLSDNFEILYGNLHKIGLDLSRPIDLVNYPEHPIDRLFAAYNPYAHLDEDFFNNKIAFIILLNFPTYSLKEKDRLGADWDRRQWAFARMGDVYSSRVPAGLLQKRSEAMTEADRYISQYNIYVGFLQDDKRRTFFDTTKKLITHWNLRDEIKALYGTESPLERQTIIFEVMKRIVSQEIPEQVINSNKYLWNPYDNKVYDGDNEIKATPEPNTRYRHIINIFKTLRDIDGYCPAFPTYIQRKFEGEMEIPQEEVEKLFVDYVSSPVVKKVGKLIAARLGRKLEPFDIWYDGFKARSFISDETLSGATKAKYPNKEALAADLPRILKDLGFKPEKAEYISSKIEVDPSRGAGHAAGSEMKSDKSHLRTRIGDDGMDYKGYNIAVHEFGHNVEQTITMQDMDYYMLHGVPNTACTEAWAFIFQKRDLALIGMEEKNENKKYLDALDAFWSTYEIMGVSLVDMRVWKWLYANPDATPEQLKAAVVGIAKEVWNDYFAEVFGLRDQAILAIYSHMIDYPLYLSAYPIGKLIEFQIGRYMEGKNLAAEMQRILRQGRILPGHWMKGAVGDPISARPLIEAAEEALGRI